MSNNTHSKLSVNLDEKDVKEFVKKLKQEKAERLQRMEAIKQKEIQKQLEKQREIKEEQNKQLEDQKNQKVKEFEEFEAQIKQREEERKERKKEWMEQEKMGIAKWSLQHAHKKNQLFIRKLSNSPSLTDPNDDMEIAYAHVRYQKSFDMKEQQEEHEKFEEMKQNRKHQLQPMSAEEIKKFGKHYETIRRQLLRQRINERNQLERTKEIYVPPKFTNIGKSCMKEEADQKEYEELKRSERLQSNKKRNKYWKLIRDLHPPKISDLKKQEMEKLVERFENKRMLVERKSSLNKTNIQHNQSTDSNPHRNHGLENLRHNHSLFEKAKKKNLIKK